MRPDLGELHIYAGIAIAALGAGLTFGLGFGLIVLGLGLVPVGVVIAMAPAMMPKAPGPAGEMTERVERPFEALMAAGRVDVADEAT